MDLTAAASTTLPFENLTTTRVLALNPGGTHLLSFDEDGRALFCALRARCVLHHMRFKGPVAAARFSPDGAFFALCVGKLLQVWRTPALAREFAPFQLHRTYAGPYEALSCVAWSPCGRWLLCGGRDASARLFSRDPVRGFTPPTLAGHRDRLVACFWAPDEAGEAAEAGAPPRRAYTLSRDGALFAWKRGGAGARAPHVRNKRPGAPHDGDDAEEEAAGAAHSLWALERKHFFGQSPARLTCADFHAPSGLLVAGFSSGVFTLHRLAGAVSAGATDLFEALQVLSVSAAPVTSCAFGADGAWVALGCARLGQLLVWEWRSETYVLRQQGHAHDVNCLAYSPDGASLATGADDAKLKVWTASAGACFVTFKDHTAPVSAVAFAPSGSAVLSASMDGTVRAFDLVRYRNFRTLTAPTPCQFASLAVDPSGEVVAAGAADTFSVCVWSLKTGRLLDVLGGHEAPVVSLAFSPVGPLLASGSWDKSVRLWDVFEGGRGAVESLPHAHDVLAVAFRPDGKQLCSAALDGQLFFWSSQDGALQGTVEGRRDASGGRARADRRTAASASAGGRAFSSLCYSADGSLLLAAGNSKYVCMYDVAERVLLRRFQITHSRAVDGVLDSLDSRRMTDAGPLELLPRGDSSEEDEDADFGRRRKGSGAMPGAGGAAGASGASAARGAGARRVARVKCVRLSPTGGSFAAATSEGVLLFSLDREAAFDPADLGEDVTPAAALAALAAGAHARALLLALRLNDAPLLRAALERTPPDAVRATAAAAPHAYLPRLLAALAEAAESSPHVEHVLRWVAALCAAHGRAMQERAAALLPACRALTRQLARLHDDLGATAGANVYALRALCDAPPDDANPSGLVLVPADASDDDDDDEDDMDEEEEP